MSVAIISANTTGSYSGTYSGVNDTELVWNDANTNRSTERSIQTTKYAAGDHRHILIAFPGLSNLPSSATVTDVTLGWYLSDASGTSNVIGVRRALRNWVNAQVTWNVYATGSSWTTAGCLSDGNDRSATLSYSSAVGNTLGWVTYASAQLVTDVQNFINGTWSNYGWHMERNESGEDHQYRVWRSSDDTDGMRPYLSVTYNTDAAARPVFLNLQRQFRN